MYAALTNTQIKRAACNEWHKVKCGTIRRPIAVWFSKVLAPIIKNLFLKFDKSIHKSICFKVAMCAILEMYPNA